MLEPYCDSWPGRRFGQAHDIAVNFDRVGRDQPDGDHRKEKINRAVIRPDAQVGDPVSLVEIAFGDFHPIGILDREPVKEEIKKMTAEYQKKQLVMSNDKRAEEEQRIQKKMMEYRELVQQSEAMMQKRQMELTQPIIDNLRNVIADIASKDKYDLVYEKNQSGIFFASNAKDITDEAIKGYDDKIKSTDVKKGKK